MNETSRIPALRDTSPDGMLFWFAEMSVGGLLFHVDDDPASIFNVDTNARVFSDNEAAELRESLARLFAQHGEGVYDAVYPIAMKAAGIRLDS